MCVISATRERLTDEIIPVSAESSHTLHDNEEQFAAAHAIDLDLDSIFGASQGADGKTWLKLNLAKLNCIQQVIWYKENPVSPFHTWTCTSSDCSSCVGKHCRFFLLTVSSDRTSSDNPPLIDDCKYGDTVKLERLDATNFALLEIAITGMIGEIRYW